MYLIVKGGDNYEEGWKILPQSVKNSQQMHEIKRIWGTFEKKVVLEYSPHSKPGTSTFGSFLGHQIPALEFLNFLTS